jgi:hypothetical protein
LLLMNIGSGRKILIIEDESDMADLLALSLRKAGFTHWQSLTAQAVCRRRGITGRISSFLI